MRFDKGQKGDFFKGDESRQHDHDSDHLLSFRLSVDKVYHDVMHAPLANPRCELCNGSGELHWIACNRQYRAGARFKSSRLDSIHEYLDPRYDYSAHTEVINNMTIISDHCTCKWPKHKPLLGIHFNDYFRAFQWIRMQVSKAKGIKLKEIREITTIEELAAIIGG